MNTETKSFKRVKRRSWGISVSEAGKREKQKPNSADKTVEKTLAIARNNSRRKTGKGGL